VFCDIGNAWDRADQMDNLPLPTEIYGGIGWGLRVNLGIFVLRYDQAWKTDWREYVRDMKNYVSLGAEF
jgi:outer membrane translocation and assembly module TamA